MVWQRRKKCSPNLKRLKNDVLIWVHHLKAFLTYPPRKEVYTF